MIHSVTLPISMPSLSLRFLLLRHGFPHPVAAWTQSSMVLLIIPQRLPSSTSFRKFYNPIRIVVVVLWYRFRILVNASMNTNGTIEPRWITCHKRGWIAMLCDECFEMYVVHPSYLWKDEKWLWLWLWLRLWLWLW